MAALKLDPEHTHFRIGYSEYLLGVRPQERRRVTDELKDIASNRIWTPLLAALTRRTSEGEEDCSANVVYLDVEDEAARDRRYRLARCHHMTGDKYFGTARLREGVPRLAFVLCGAGISASAQVGIALSRLRARVADLEIIAIDTAIDVRAQSSLEADVLLTMPQPGAVAYSSKAIADAVRYVRAPYTMIAQPDTFAIDQLVDCVLEQVGGSLEDAIDCAAPIVVLRDARGRASAKEILCVGASTALLREASLPQRIGMLQDAQLALPLLVRQLRPSHESFLVIDDTAGPPRTETSASPELDLARFVTPLEDSVLTTLSTDWRLFNVRQELAIPKSRVQLSILPTASREDAPESNKDQGADRRSTRYHLVIEMDRTSIPYRLARKLHQSILAGRTAKSGAAFAAGNATSSRVAFIGIEHTYAGLRIKVPIFRGLVARFAQTAGS
jgi:hypothetical protein